MYEMSCQSRFNARYWMLGAGVLGRPRGMDGLGSDSGLCRHNSLEQRKDPLPTPGHTCGANHKSKKCIRWSDQVMLEGVNSEDKEMLTAVRGVIKAVLDGVKVRAGPGGLSGDLQLPHCRLLVSQELVPKLLNVGAHTQNT